MCCVPSLLTLHVQFKLVKSSNSSELIWYFFHVFFNYSCLMLKVCMFVCSFRWNKKKLLFDQLCSLFHFIASFERFCSIRLSIRTIIRLSTCPTIPDGTWALWSKQLLVPVKWHVLRATSTRHIKPVFLVSTTQAHCLYSGSNRQDKGVIIERVVLDIYNTSDCFISAAEWNTIKGGPNCLYRPLIDGSIEVYWMSRQKIEKFNIIWRRKPEFLQIQIYSVYLSPIILATVVIPI